MNHTRQVTWPGILVTLLISTVAWAVVQSVTGSAGVNAIGSTDVVVSLNQGYSPTWTGIHTFGANGITFSPDMNVVVQPQNASGIGPSMSIIAPAGGGVVNTVDSSVFIKGGQSLSASRYSGDAVMMGGSRGIGLAAGDVLLNCPADALVGDCGIDVGFGPTVSAVWLGHNPASANDITGRVFVLGRVSTDILFTGDHTVGAETSAGIGATITHSSGNGGPTGAPGIVRLQPGTAGAGSPTVAPGAGGNIEIYATNAGTNNGFGSPSGGTITARIGAGNNGGLNGAINLGYSGPVPSGINIGQAGGTTTLHGTVVLPALADLHPEVVNPASNYNITLTGYKVFYSASLGSARAVILPDPNTIVGAQRFEIACAVNNQTIYIYQRPNLMTPIKTLTCTTAHHYLVEASPSETWALVDT